ncbi:MAG: ABC transporter substrate-binding protein [Oscillospiraceae bacterium]|nr:ABC transporter substrate-binding protein [Oscillospiraceae bacterium]
MKFKKILTAVLAAAMTCSLAACSNGGSSTPGSGDVSTDNSIQLASTDKVLNIGISKMMDHTAMNKSEKGFVDALESKGYVDGQNIKIDYQNGQGETSNLNTIATQFVGNKVDLIFAIATPAAQACFGQTTEIPIIGTAITDFADAGLVNDNNNPGTNVSGTTDMNPIEEQIDLLLELFPDTKTIGFVYTASEQNSVLQCKLAKEYIESKGLKTTEKTIINTNDIQQAVSSIVTECDALYLPTDNQIASAMSLVSSVCNTEKIPVICGENGMVENGGFGTLSINYYDLGFQAGLMAVEVLEGADISKMAIQKSTNYEYAFNEDAVAALEITLPDKYKDFVVKTASAE